MARGLERPPGWALVLLAVSAVALVVLGVLVINRSGPPPLTAQQEQRYAELDAEAEAARAAEEARIDIAVIGDSYTGGSRMDSGDSARWPSLLSEQYPWDFHDFATGGTGFLNRGPENAQTTFAERVADVIAAEPEAVIVEGGHNDTDFPVTDFRAAAEQVVTEVRAGLPEARLVVIGVIWPGEPPAKVLEMNAALADVATASGAVFIDPLADSWFRGDRRGLIGSDNTHPTDEGHRFLAERIGAALAAAGLPTAG